MNGHIISYFGQSVILYPALKFFLRYFPVKSVNKLGSLITVNHIPHFGFAVFTFVFKSIFVIWVYLNRQSVLCVDKLYK